MEVSSSNGKPFLTYDEQIEKLIKIKNSLLMILSMQRNY